MRLIRSWFERRRRLCALQEALRCAYAAHDLRAADRLFQQITDAQAGRSGGAVCETRGCADSAYPPGNRCAGCTN